MADVPIYLVFGPDEFRVSEKTKEILDRLLPEADRALGLDRINGQASTSEEAMLAIGRCSDALQTVGFFGSRRVVWLCDASFLSDTVCGKSAEVKDRLTGLTRVITEGLQGDNVLIVTAPQVDRRYAFYKACAARGHVSEFSISEKAYQADQDAGAFAQEQLKRVGLSMRADVLEQFIQRVGVGSRQIVSEVEKLATYVGNRHDVKVADVEAVTSSSRQAMAWDLADAVGNRDLSRAIELIRQLLFQSRKEAPIRLVVSVEGRIRELAFYREAIDRKWLFEQGGRNGVAWGKIPDSIEVSIAAGMKKDPRKIHPYRQGLLAQQAKRFTALELCQAHQAVVDACQKLVTGSVSSEGVLEMLMVRILSKAASRS